MKDFFGDEPTDYEILRFKKLLNGEKNMDVNPFSIHHSFRKQTPMENVIEQYTQNEICDLDVELPTIEMELN